VAEGAALEARVVELESRCAVQEDLIVRLNDALVAQQARIDRLEAKLNVVVDQIRGFEGAGDEPADERPPHY
jgi:SlyX protein